MGAKRMTITVIVALVLCCTFLACSSPTAASSDNAENGETIVVGAANYPPFYSLDENGDPVGMDVDIANEAFSRIGYNAEFKEIVWGDKDELLASGEIDCIMNSFSMEGRENQYTWAGPYASGQIVIAVPSSSSIYSLADLQGKVVAAQSGTQAEGVLMDKTNPDVPQLRNVFSFEDQSLLYPSLTKGYVDAIAVYRTSMEQYLKDYGVSCRMLDESLSDVHLGVGFARNGNAGIAQRLTQAFESMRADGTMCAILSKYVSNPSEVADVSGYGA